MVEREGVVASEPAQETSLRKQFLNWRTLAAFLVSFLIIYFFLSRLNVDLGQTWEMIANANPFLFGLALVVYYLAFPLRGLRWKILLRNVGFQESQGVHLPPVLGLGRFVAMGWFANCILPAKLGDAYRAYLVKRDAGVSFSKTVGTVLAERAIDLGVVFLLLIVAAVAVFQSQRAPQAMTVVQVGLALVLVMAVGLALMWRFGATLHRFLPSRLRGLYQLFHEGTFHSFRNLPPIILMSILIWLIEAARVYLVSQSLGLSISLALILFVALADAVLVGIPLTPGGLGLVEAGVTAILLLAVTKEQAASLALLDRSISYWSILLLGAGLHLWDLRQRNARRNRLHTGG